MATLADKLSDLANVAPIFQDPEDDLSDLTLAKLAHRGDEIDSHDKFASHTKRSALRTKSVKLLSEEDNKYVGKKISRQKLLDVDLQEQKVNTKALHALKKKFDNDSSDEEEVGSQKTKTKRKVNGNLKNKVQSMSLNEYGSDDEDDDEDDNDDDNNDDDDMYNVEDDDNELKNAEKHYQSVLKKAVNQFNRSFSDDDDDNDDDDDDDDNFDFSKDFLIEEDKSEKKKGKSKLNGKKDEFSFVDDGDYGKYGDDDDEEEDMDDDNDDESDLDDDDDLEDDEDDEEIDSDEVDDPKNKKTKTVIEKDGIKQFSLDTNNEDVEKGKAAKNQLAVWDGLLESRIKLQKTVSSINQLPQPSIWSLFTELGGDDFNDLATDAQYELRTLLDKLVQLQTILLLQNPATNKIVTKQDQETIEPPSTKGKAVTSVSPEDDEEITSDEEDGGENKTTPQVVLPAKRKIPLDEYPEFLAKRHKDFIPFRNETINKWNSKTQLVSGKIKSKGFSAFNQSALKQIDQILSDKDRLIKRTQLKRNDYRVMGTTQEEKPEEELPNDEVVNERPINSAVNDYDVEIFDDSDFYHHMLREFIDRKSSEIDDPLALGRQWLEVQKSRTKVKRNVDTKASKGRKLRYNVHPKLVNFMAPVDFTDWNDDARDDLYKSLFGQKVTIPEETS